MDLFSGIKYNLQGLVLGLKTPKLFLLGFVRLAAVIIITIATASLILIYHQELLDLIWTKPESRWFVWLWHIVSWLLSLLLVGVSAVLSYLFSQILFCVLIMDYMSRITERMRSAHVNEPEKVPLIQLFIYLIKQEIPRAVLPVLISLTLMLLGWLTPLGPILAALTSISAVIFLAWDNTDLVPARRMLPFKQRFSLLKKSLMFHLGFGLWFLIPLLNILFLSFAPVGATLYHMDRDKGNDGRRVSKVGAHAAPQKNGQK